MWKRKSPLSYGSSLRELETIVHRSMASIPIHENSWADQWDYNPDRLPASVTKKNSAGSSAKAKYSKKVEEGFGKTKAVAANGMAKVKVGARFGLHWIKDKFHKTTGKQ